MGVVLGALPLTLPIRGAPLLAPLTPGLPPLLRIGVGVGRGVGLGPPLLIIIGPGALPLGRGALPSLIIPLIMGLVPGARLTIPVIGLIIPGVAPPPKPLRLTPFIRPSPGCVLLGTIAPIILLPLPPDLKFLTETEVPPWLPPRSLRSNPLDLTPKPPLASNLPISIVHRLLATPVPGSVLTAQFPPRKNLIIAATFIPKLSAIPPSSTATSAPQPPIMSWDRRAIS